MFSLGPSSLSCVRKKWAFHRILFRKLSIFSINFSLYVVLGGIGMFFNE